MDTWLPLVIIALMGFEAGFAIGWLKGTKDKSFH